MTVTATAQAVPRQPKKICCDDCGASADVILVPDAAEDASGYRGDKALCRACLAEREARDE